MSGERKEQALRDGLEPVALAHYAYTDEHLYRASTAVSAKRQADALERIAAALNDQEISGSPWGGFTTEQVALAVEHARREGIIG